MFILYSYTCPGTYVLHIFVQIFVLHMDFSNFYVCYMSFVWTVHPFVWFSFISCWEDPFSKCYVHYAFFHLVFYPFLNFILYSYTCHGTYVMHNVCTHYLHRLDLCFYVGMSATILFSISLFAFCVLIDHISHMFIIGYVFLWCIYVKIQFFPPYALGVNGWLRVLLVRGTL